MVAASHKIFLELLCTFHIARFNLEMKSNTITGIYLADLFLD